MAKYLDLLLGGWQYHKVEQRSSNTFQVTAAHIFDLATNGTIGNSLPYCPRAYPKPASAMVKTPLTIAARPCGFFDSRGLGMLASTWERIPRRRRCFP
jgi:hypothetical protein